MIFAVIAKCVEEKDTTQQQQPDLLKKNTSNIP